MANGPRAQMNRMMSGGDGPLWVVLEMEPGPDISKQDRIDVEQQLVNELTDVPIFEFGNEDVLTQMEGGRLGIFINTQDGDWSLGELQFMADTAEEIAVQIKVLRFLGLRVMSNSTARGILGI